VYWREAVPRSMIKARAFAKGSCFLCLPGLADVDHVDSIRTSLPQIWLHVNLQVL
jgi:hypothetical protein